MECRKIQKSAKDEFEQEIEDHRFVYKDWGYIPYFDMADQLVEWLIN